MTCFTLPWQLIMSLQNEITSVITLRQSSSKINSILFKDKVLLALDEKNILHSFGSLFGDGQCTHETARKEAHYIFLSENDLLEVWEGKVIASGQPILERVSKLSYTSPALFNKLIVASADTDDGKVLVFHTEQKQTALIDSGAGMLLGLANTSEFLITLNDDGNITLFDSELSVIGKEKTTVPGACCIAADASHIIVGSASGFLLHYSIIDGSINLASKKRYANIISKVHLNLPFVFVAFSNGTVHVYELGKFEEPLFVAEHTPATAFLNINDCMIPHWYKQNCVYNKATVVGCQNGIIRIIGLSELY